MKRLLCYIAACSLVLLALAQQKIYDPMLDPNVKMQAIGQQEVWDGSAYMWYPGQLAAYRQQSLREQSKGRCVNVGYPGNFNPMQQVTWFKTTVQVQEPTTIELAAAGAESVEVTDNGVSVNHQLSLSGAASAKDAGIDLAESRENRTKSIVNSQFSIKNGKHELVFKVATNNQLPALMVKRNGSYSISQVQSSINNVTWMPVESDSRYNQPAISPNHRLDKELTIHPKSIIPIKNAKDNHLGRYGSVVYDFWYDEVGSVTLEATGTGKLHFTVGESMEEVLNEDTSKFEQFPIEDVQLTGNRQTITLPERGLRYVKVTASEPTTIHQVLFHAVMWPVDEMLMTFESSDEALNDLFNAGVATLHTSMHEFNLDGIKRDFLPWSMDAVASMLGMNFIMADRQVARNNISIALMPPSPKQSDWGIVDYPLHALIGLKQDYLRFGDLTSIELYKDRIFQQLDLYVQAQDERGFIRAAKPSSGFIPGWSRDNGPDDYGVACYPQIMLYENFRIAAYFCQLLQENAKAKFYARKADQLQHNILEHFWDTEQKAFVNGYREDGSLDKRVSHHAQYWAVLTGLYPERLYDYLYETVIPSIPRYKDNISYEKGYEALAYIKAGRTKEFLQLLDEVWGDWLRQGYTRFPENFMVNDEVTKQLMFYGRSFGLSLCHGANGVPPIVLAAHGIFGFSQHEQQINHYTLSPNLLHLDWVQGRIPVKEGFITIRLNKLGQNEVEIPVGCQVTINYGGQVLVFKKAGKYSF